MSKSSLSIADAKPVQKHPTACAMCAAIAAGPEAPEWDRALIETDSFVVIPSLGAMIEGWLLIAPKAHFLSLASMPARMMFEFEELKARVGDRLTQSYGSVTFFEHGPCASNSLTGCGVDHAHLHAVPVPPGVPVATASHLPRNVSLGPGTFADCRQAVSSSRDYLYFEGNEGTFVAIADSFKSQTFRRAIGDLLGMGEKSDWRTHPHIGNIRATIQTLTSTLEQPA